MNPLFWMLTIIGTVSLVATFAYAFYLRRHPDVTRGPWHIGIPSGITGALFAYPVLTLLDAL